MDYIIREIAKTLDLDVDKVTNSIQEAAIQAEIMKAAKEQGGATTPVAGADPNDPTGAGGGTIEQGQVPVFENKDLQEMHNPKELHNKLKGVVNNPKTWEHLSNYLDFLIEIQQRSLEQTDNQVMMYRSQGAISSLRRLKNLRDEVNRTNG